MCEGCKFYTWEKVPVDPFDDDGTQYGFTRVQMCTASPVDKCPVLAGFEKDPDFIEYRDKYSDLRSFDRQWTPDDLEKYAQNEAQAARIAA